MIDRDKVALEIFKTLIVDSETFNEWYNKNDRSRYPGTYNTKCEEYIKHVSELVVKQADILIKTLEDKNSNNR